MTATSIRVTTLSRTRGQRQLAVADSQAICEHYGYRYQSAYEDNGKVFVGSDYVGQYVAPYHITAGSKVRRVPAEVICDR